jgi:hypothetical protein
MELNFQHLLVASILCVCVCVCVCECVYLFPQPHPASWDICTLVPSIMFSWIPLTMTKQPSLLGRLPTTLGRSECTSLGFSAPLCPLKSSYCPLTQAGDSEQANWPTLNKAQGQFCVISEGGTIKDIDLQDLVAGRTLHP